MKKFAIAAVAAAGIALGVGACAPPSTSTSYTPPPPPAAKTVEYQVDGTSNAGFLTYQNPTGVAQSDSALPLTPSIQYPSGQFHAGDFVYMSVQNQHDSGTVTCRILVDGVVISQNTASGAYVIATCSGSA